MSKLINIEKADIIRLIISTVLLISSSVIFFKVLPHTVFYTLTLTLTDLFYTLVLSLSPVLAMASLFTAIESIHVLRRFSGKVLENCPLVIGTIIYVNKYPSPMISVQFRTIDGQLVTVNTCDYALGMKQFEAQIQLGMPIPLRYNPDEPEEITIAIDEKKETLQRELNMLWFASELSAQEEIEITKHGVKATGVIFTARPTGNIINNCGEIALKVKVTRPEDGSIFYETTKKAIPQNMLSFVQPDKIVEVYYMLKNEKIIVVKV